jgi:hypothetical protein
MYYLNDIVLDFDHSTARWAYISDTLGHKLVVYDRKNDHSYAFTHASMKPVPLYANPDHNFARTLIRNVDTTTWNKACV